MQDALEMTGDLRGKTVVLAAVNGGMIANFGRDVAEALVDAGTDVHYFASGLPVFGWEPPIADLEALGGKYHAFPFPQELSPLKDMQSFWGILRALSRIRPHIVHTRSTKMGLVGRITAKMLGVPIVIHQQDDLYVRNPRLSPLLRKLIGFLEKSLASISDCLFFGSEAVLEDALALGFPRERCVMVGYDLNAIFREAASAPELVSREISPALLKLGIPAEAKILGCIGRLTANKGIDLLLDVIPMLAEAFPDWVYVIKGDGPLREGIQTRILANQLEQKVFLMTEELAATELPAIYRSFDIFTLPTRLEGFGMVFAEAMAMGLPVVAPRIAPVTEIVSPDTGILVEPDNVLALREALSQLMGNAQLRAEIGQKAHERAVEKWCRKKAAHKVMTEYQGLLNKKQVKSR